jgi:hypothetical protein
MASCIYCSIIYVAYLVPRETSSFFRSQPTIRTCSTIREAKTIAALHVLEQAQSRLPISLAFDQNFGAFFGKLQDFSRPRSNLHSIPFNLWEGALIDIVVCPIVQRFPEILPFWGIFRGFLKIFPDTLQGFPIRRFSSFRSYRCWYRRRCVCIKKDVNTLEIRGKDSDFRFLKFDV